MHRHLYEGGEHPDEYEVASDDSEFDSDEFSDPEEEEHEKEDEEDENDTGSDLEGLLLARTRILSTIPMLHPSAAATKMRGRSGNNAPQQILALTAARNGREWQSSKANHCRIIVIR